MGGKTDYMRFFRKDTVKSNGTTATIYEFYRAIAPTADCLGAASLDLLAQMISVAMQDNRNARVYRSQYPNPRATGASYIEIDRTPEEVKGPLVSVVGATSDSDEIIELGLKIDERLRRKSESSRL